MGHSAESFGQKALGMGHGGMRDTGCGAGVRVAGYEIRSDSISDWGLRIWDLRFGANRFIEIESGWID